MLCLARLKKRIFAHAYYFFLLAVQDKWKVKKKDQLGKQEVTIVRQASTSRTTRSDMNSNEVHDAFMV